MRYKIPVIHAQIFCYRILAEFHHGDTIVLIVSMSAGWIEIEA